MSSCQQSRNARIRGASDRCASRDSESHRPHHSLDQLLSAFGTANLCGKACFRKSKTIKPRTPVAKRVKVAGSGVGVNCPAEYDSISELPVKFTEGQQVNEGQTIMQI